MKFFSFILLFCCVGLSSIVAQDAALNDNMRQYAMQLDDYTLGQLLSTTWHCQDRQVMKKDGYWNQTTPFSLRFMADQKFSMNDGTRFVNGAWEIVNGNEMNFVVSAHQESDLNEMVQKGSYFIYKVTDRTMIMHKKLATSVDYQHFFRFYSEDTHNYVQEHKKAYTLPIRSGKTYNPNLSEEERKRIIITRLNAIAQTKGLNTNKDLETLSMEELKDLLENAKDK